MNNRIYNATNPNQGPYKRVLCVCSAGLLRSPTLAFALAQRGYNTRAAGSSPNYALIPVDDALFTWANEIVFVNKENLLEVQAHFPSFQKDYGDKVTVLKIPDRYQYRDPELVSICDKQYDEAHV